VTSTPLTFTWPQHDRVADRRTDDRWLAQQWEHPGCRVLVVGGSSVKVDAANGHLAWCTAHELSADHRSADRYLLGVDQQGRAVFAVSVDLPEADSGVRGLRELALTESAADLQWACHAVALAQWHQAHQHCARCGAATEVYAAGAERRCPVDGSTHFPRVDPAVIVLVTDEHDRALLGRQESWPDGRFSTLAGFVEPGESAEQAVMREVAEESGVTVEQVQILATQPWPFPSSLMIGASAMAPGSPDPRPDGVELAEVRWFSRGDLRAGIEAGDVLVPGTISISRWLIERWFGTDLPDGQRGWR
jgi:NAD+ diphosphatase